MTGPGVYDDPIYEPESDVDHVERLLGHSLRHQHGAGDMVTIPVSFGTIKMALRIIQQLRENDK